MRHMLYALPLVLVAAPAIAQPQPQPEAIQIPPELTDPATAAKLANMARAMSDAFLDLPVGRSRLPPRDANPRSRKSG